MKLKLSCSGKCNRKPTSDLWLSAAASAALMIMLGADGGALAQTAPGDWTGQALPTILSVPGGPTYNQLFQQSFTTEAGPTCYNPSTGGCSPAEAAAGDVTAASNVQFFGTKSAVSGVPAAATALGTTASVNVQGEYADSASPTGVSYVNASIPLNEFATSSSVAAETSRAENVENTLGSEIHAETAARIADIARVNRGYRMGVATAIALSGLGVIPGKRFNLTLNTGTYEGQWAVAAQGAYLVGNHAMLNAGVSTSATGQGTGARAGITLGW